MMAFDCRVPRAIRWHDIKVKLQFVALGKVPGAMPASVPTRRVDMHTQGWGGNHPLGVPPSWSPTGQRRRVADAWVPIHPFQETWPPPSAKPLLLGDKTVALAEPDIIR